MSMMQKRKSSFINLHKMVILLIKMVKLKSLLILKDAPLCLWHLLMMNVGSMKIVMLWEIKYQLGKCLCWILTCLRLMEKYLFITYGSLSFVTCLMTPLTGSDSFSWDPRKNELINKNLKAYKKHAINLYFFDFNLYFFYYSEYCYWWRKNVNENWNKNEITFSSWISLGNDN